MNCIKGNLLYVVLLAASLLVAGSTAPAWAQKPDDLALIKENGDPAGDEPIDLLIAQVNSELERRGAPYRVGGVWMFTIGAGRSPNRRLQRGTRWVPGDPRRFWSTGTEEINYVVYMSDLTLDILPAQSEAALDSSFGTWSNVKNTFLDLVKVADDGLNHDFLDNFPAVPSFPPCTFPGILDLAALDPNADIIVGGWLPREYFDCLTPGGGDFILAVTWTFSFGTDVNNDGYVDTALKEVYFNEVFNWVISGSAFLDISRVDIESVAVHEH
ncbi:MAG: hypothetical protein ACE5HB_01875, partial [Terriglobia bacterium]